MANTLIKEAENTFQDNYTTYNHFNFEVWVYAYRLISKQSVIVGNKNPVLQLINLVAKYFDFIFPNIIPINQMTSSGVWDCHIFVFGKYKQS